MSTVTKKKVLAVLVLIACCVGIVQPAQAISGVGPDVVMVVQGYACPPTENPLGPCYTYKEPNGRPFFVWYIQGAVLAGASLAPSLAYAYEYPYSDPFLGIPYVRPTHIRVNARDWQREGYFPTKSERETGSWYMIARHHPTDPRSCAVHKDSLKLAMFDQRTGQRIRLTLRADPSIVSSGVIAGVLCDYYYPVSDYVTDPAQTLENHISYLRTGALPLPRF